MITWTDARESGTRRSRSPTFKAAIRDLGDELAAAFEGAKPGTGVP
jgi:hypothetical protein